MIALIVFLTCLLAAVFSGVLAALSDFRGLLIPNIYSVIVAGAFALGWGALALLGHGDVLPGLWSSVLAAGIFFAVTAALFAFGVLGAADSKLGTAYALWVGLGGLPMFLIYMTLLGGVLGVVALVLQKKKPLANPPQGSWLARVQEGESKVPYGIAIVLGVLVCFANLGYFSLSTLTGFFS